MEFTQKKEIVNWAPMHFIFVDYVGFDVKGSYMNMPQASGMAFDRFKEQDFPKRDDFNIEHYVNNPATTPEDQLLTEILIPVK